MFPAGKAADARDFDRLSMDKGVLSLILMENAAFSLYLEVTKLIEEFEPRSIVAFVGKGGNGGDGLALLRILRDRGCQIPMKVVPFFNPEELTGDIAANWKIRPNDIEITDDLQISGSTLVIDAMIGIGLTSDLRGKILEAVNYINGLKDVKVVAVDVPTGLNSDTGEIMGEAIKADLTVTFGIYKTGLFAAKGPALCGRLVLGKISGIYKDSYRYMVLDENELEPVDVKIDSYKNSNGHLLIVGGDVEKLGATIISAKSFLFSGGGLVTAAFEKRFHEQIAGKMPSLMLADTEKAVTELNKYDAVVIGPGLMKWPFERVDVFKNYKGIIIVDAGMFDILKENESTLDSLKNCKVVFTPHPGELKRFLDGAEDPWIDLVDRFPLEKDHVLVAKSHSSFIRAVSDVRIVPPGARALSFGGTGDALTGILAFEIIRNGLEKGVQRGVLRHRLAGIMLERKFGSSCHDMNKLLEFIGETGK